MQYKTANGGTIIVPQKTETHLLAHPEVQGLLEETIRKITLPKDKSFLKVVVNLGRVLGLETRVSVKPVAFNEETTFAYRKERLGPSHVCVNPENRKEVNTVVVLASSGKMHNEYFLVTAWIGDLAPYEPWDKNLAPKDFQESLDFWSKNSLVYDPAVMGPVFKSSWAEEIKKVKNNQ